MMTISIVLVSLIYQLFCNTHAELIYAEEDTSLCRKLCYNIPQCVELCAERQRQPYHQSYQLPSCGLSTFTDPRAPPQPNVHKRIKGGKKADLFEYPFIVSLFNNEETTYENDIEILDHRCGGVILNKKFILTAAHCYYDFNETCGGSLNCLRIMLASNSLEIGDVNQIVMRPELIAGEHTFINHPKFVHNDPTMDYDIALIKLSRPIEMLVRDNRFIVNSICLPEPGVVHKGEANVIGWGLTDPKNSADSYPMILRKLKVPLQEYLNCRHVWKVSIRHIVPEEVINDFLPKQPFLCAGNLTVGSAVGDSGGPLFREHNGRSEVLGMVAFGGGPRSPLNYPAGFTMVSKYMEWITDTILQNS